MADGKGADAPKVEGPKIDELLLAINRRISELSEQVDRDRKAAADKKGGDASMNDEAMLALQRQIADFGERHDRLVSQFARLSRDLPFERLARLERLASVFGAVVCEMHTSTIKSDITALQKEIVELLLPIRASFDAPVKELADVA